MTSRLARIRAARRAHSAGGIVFIVAMTIAVLAAMGMYALRAASMEVRTSGHERQSAQTHYLAEYGVLGAAQEVNVTKAELYVGLMRDPLTRDTACQSLAPSFTVSGAVQSNFSLACRRMGALQLADTWKYNGAQILPLVPWTSAAQPGSLGSAPMFGDFVVELTDAAKTTPPAGFDLKLGFCFMQITVTSTGITQPIYIGGTDPNTAIFSSEGLETARARIVAGPVRVGCGPQ